MAVTITENAAKEICNIVRQQELDPEKISLRVGVKGGGCSGFSYMLDLTETQKDSDEIWETTYTIPAPKGLTNGDAKEDAAKETISFNIRVICDPKSYLYLNGTEIDFKDEVMGRGFVFGNPNATSTCGCGSSFSA